MSEDSLDFDVDASDLRVGIVAARFNRQIVDRLVDGAMEALAEAGSGEDDVELVWVAGAFEIPVVLRAMAVSGEYDALVAMGAVVRGDTPHFEYVAGECARGCLGLAVQTGVPIAFGVLTTDTWEQAEERAGGRLGNKGAEAALTAVETARILEDL